VTEHFEAGEAELLAGLNKVSRNIIEISIDGVFISFCAIRRSAASAPLVVLNLT
jgi:hypothetical protein